MTAAPGAAAPATAPVPVADPVGALAAGLRRLGSVVVAFSGGAGSAFLARVAHDVLGPERCLAATAVSPSLAACRAASAASSGC
mgnify:CR=1 FL=1